MPLLYVEDDLTVARSVGRVLARDVDVVVAHSVDEAKRLLESSAEPWCCLADLDLGPQAPRGGLDVLRLVRARDPLAPLAVLTGHDEASAREAAAELSAVYIVKASADAAFGARFEDGLHHFGQVAARWIRVHPPSRPRKSPA